MLLSLSHKFIFIANLKTASSSIERILEHAAEISLRRTEHGKHDSLTQISHKFPWVRKYVPYNEFFVFGVLRDPVDFLLSLYNSHNKEAFDGMPHSTKDKPFGEFLSTWCVRNWQARPQSARFRDEHGRFRITHVVDFADLDEELPRIQEKLGLPVKQLPKTNVSPEIATRADLSPDDIEKIAVLYADDYALLNNRPKAI